ncbi:MAG: HAMP domain-containing histidine kinase, partial [Calditrichaeota bacterium]|nr:HAMP domain-containing histidine kinase [Calditrichota bacterium]
MSTGVLSLFLLVNQFYFNRYTYLLGETSLFLQSVTSLYIIKKYDMHKAIVFYLCAMPATLFFYFTVGNVLFPVKDSYYQLTDFILIVVFQLFFNGLFAPSKRLNGILILLDLVILADLSYYLTQTVDGYKGERILVATISYALVMIFANYFANFIAALTNDLIRKEKDLIESNEVKKKMLSIIAHDLRSPFISLNGAIQLLKQNNLSSQEKDDFTNIIFTSSSEISSLLENLLHWSATQLKGLKSEFKTINLSSICVECISLFKLEIDRKSIKIDNQLPDEVLVRADYNMIILVIRNLLSNAIKFTPQKGSITLSVTETNGKVTFTIGDTGIGMTADQIERLEKATIESSLGTANEKGSGLGLILCQDFLKLNNSKLLIDS